MYTDRGATKVRPLPRRGAEEWRKRPASVAPRDDAHGSADERVLREPTPLPSPLARVEAMSAEECLRAYRAGRLTRAERTAWAAAYPEEVPIVNDEFEWIGLLAE
jgi:hypothetical protein